MNHFLNFDIYSKRIGFFFNEKEKIGTFFGLFLSLLYILIFLAFFAIHIFFTIKRVNIRIYDTTVYLKDIPNININPNLIYFAFGLEDPKKTYRFIDESIYYPKIFFYEKTKINGDINITEKKELEYEICQKENFGSDYENLLNEDELNNSYCLKNYNLSLTGGYNHNKMSYINIYLYPCINNTENNNHCKPQEIIDSYLKGGYFSILIKDIGLDPKNYTSPVIHTLKKLHTTIDKSIHKEYIIYYAITEIKTDTGLFSEKIKTEKYIQFKNEYELFYFRNESDYYNDNEIISLEVRLEEKIYIQKRTYRKIYEVFYIIGGYMQFINIIFSLLALLSNSIIPELKILNGIFNFNLKEKKMTLRIHSIKDFNSIVFKKNLYFPSDKQLNNLSIKMPNNNNNNVSKNSLIGCDNDNNSSQVNIFNRKHNSLVIIKENENENEKSSYIVKKPLFNQANKQFNGNKIYNNFNSNNNNNNTNNNNTNNNNTNNNITNNNNTNNNNTNNNENIKKKYIYRVGSFFPKLMGNDKKSNSSILKSYIDQLYFNIFDYYCFRICSNKKKDIEMYNLALSLYRKRMDIINVFTLLFFSEKNCLQTEEIYL